MTAKEQSEAVRLLAEVTEALERAVAQHPSAAAVETVKRARAFLTLPLPAEPESHGSRRS